MYVLVMDDAGIEFNCLLTGSGVGQKSTLSMFYWPNDQSLYVQQSDGSEDAYRFQIFDSNIFYI